MGRYANRFLSWLQGGNHDINEKKEPLRAMPPPLLRGNNAKRRRPGATQRYDSEIMRQGQFIRGKKKGSGGEGGPDGLSSGRALKKQK